MKVEVVYASCRRDLIWLVYSLQLLFKNFNEGKGFGVTVRLEDDCRDTIKEWALPVNYVYVQPWPDTYNFHMYLKSISDQHTEAELVMLLDSDHMVLEPVSLESFLDDGKPVIRYRNWNEDPNDSDLVIGKQIWAPPVERTLGVPLDRNYMVGPPHLFRRQTFGHMRERVEKVVGLPFHDVLYSDTPYDYQKFLQHPMRFCDYEALGCYASHFEPERYTLKHHPKGTPWPIRVFWSHDWNRDVQTVLDQALTKRYWTGP